MTPTPKAKVLFVDDEQNVLNGIRRGLRNDFDVHTASSGEEALRLLEDGEAFRVIVSDCRMPNMDGIELLQRCSKVAPLSVRIMLTGNTDQETAVRAVNTGDVFKFVNKPCEVQALRQVVGLAVRQYELVTAEKEILEETLKGSIKVLADLLAIVKPEAFGRTARLRRKAHEVAGHLEGVRMWELDAATLLSQLGCVNVAPEILDKLQRGDVLSDREAADFAVDDVKRDKIPLEARILHVVLLDDDLRRQGWSDAAIVEKLRKCGDKVDPAVLAALIAATDLSGAKEVLRVLASELELGMVVQEDIRTDHGVMLLCHGQEVAPAIREHLVKFQKMGVLTKRILVARPAKNGEAGA
jgi:response regulator RpfG family c-di-GMP phosphodiesterase